MAISSPLQSKVPTGSTKTIRKLQSILINRTKVKREIFQRQTILQNRREENERRKQREDALEAPNLVRTVRGPSQLIVGSAKGFFDRLVGFLGYLTAGWIINNLPTWISMGTEFIARTQKMGKILGNFILNTTDIFKDFTRLLGATLTNLMTFDFLDTSGRVKTAFDDLNSSVDNWGTGFEDAIKLLTTPLSEGIASGENARPTGTQNTNEGAYKQSAPYSGSGGDSSELFQLIAGGEGGYESMNRGNAGDSPGGAKKYLGKNLQDMTLSEIMSLQSKGSVFAVGKYQIITETMPGFVKWLQSKGYDPKNTKYSTKIQDLYPQYTVESKRPKVGQFLSGSMNDVQKANLELAAEFASVGVPFDMKAGSYGGGWPKYDIKKGESLYSGRGGNRASITPEKVQNALKQAKSSGGNISSAQAPQQSTPGTGQSFRPLPQGSFKGGESQKFGASRDGGYRKHLGIDITESNWKPGSDPRIPVIAIRGGVVSQKNYVGGSQYLSGLVIDQDDGYSLRYLHMSPSVRPGQKVSAGQRIGRLVDLGNKTHLHIELYSGSKILDPTEYIKTVEKGGVSPSIARQQSPTPTPAQISPTGTPQNPQITESLAPERTGPTIIVSETPPPPPQQMMYSGGGGSSGGGSSQISEFALLNNFMRNKLLLDLAYL
jgi:murein DD-endopeptidase MepM/ murein hydrolase activator NlpD